MTKSTPFSIAHDVSDLDLHMIFSACNLNVMPAASVTWVAGGAQGKGDGKPLRVAQDGGKIRIVQNLSLGQLKGGSARDFSFALGKPKPFGLTVDLSAANSKLELGGLPLTRLDLHQMAANQVVSFSPPNPERMQEFTARCLAANLVVTRLLDANFTSFQLTAGTSSCVLVCGGELQHDAEIVISALMSSIVVEVPATIPTVCRMNAQLGSVKLGKGFARRGSLVGNPAGLAGEGPCLTITCDGLMSDLLLGTSKAG
jgi:hypothetical protein